MRDLRLETERFIISEKDKNSLLIAKVENLKNELKKVKMKLIDYKAGEKERKIQDEKIFLESEEFYGLLGDHAAIMFEYDFDGAMP